MAIDYNHRLVVSGPRGGVDLFRKQLRQTDTRTVGKLKWRETIPFSFERLYDLAPTAVRIEPEVPCDPYDMSVWPIRRLPYRSAEVRYQFHTRNLQVLPFVCVLSKKLPSLTFRLLTHCMDDDQIASYRVRKGRARRWILPEARHAAHWDRARQRFDLTGDEVYGDQDARHFAEEAMLEEALDHWEREAGGRHPVRRRAREWWNRPVTRDLETQRLIFMAERHGVIGPKT
jgi:hypothetical protein